MVLHRHQPERSVLPFNRHSIAAPELKSPEHRRSAAGYRGSWAGCPCHGWIEHRRRPTTVLLAVRTDPIPYFRLRVCLKLFSSVAWASCPWWVYSPTSMVLHRHQSERSVFPFNRHSIAALELKSPEHRRSAAGYRGSWAGCQCHDWIEQRRRPTTVLPAVQTDPISVRHSREISNSQRTSFIPPKFF
jgi:hypothetical protein